MKKFNIYILTLILCLGSIGLLDARDWGMDRNFYLQHFAPGDIKTMDPFLGVDAGQKIALLGKATREQLKKYSDAEGRLREIAGKNIFPDLDGLIRDRYLPMFTKNELLEMFNKGEITLEQLRSYGFK